VPGGIYVVFFSPRAVPVTGPVSSGSVLLLYHAGELCGRAVSYGVTFRPGAEGPLLALGGFGVFWPAVSTRRASARSPRRSPRRCGRAEAERSIGLFRRFRATDEAGPETATPDTSAGLGGAGRVRRRPGRL